MAEETVQVNLNKTLTSLRIISIVAGGLIACGVAWATIDNRMDKIEKAQVKFEGIMEERTRNMSDNINRIYDIVKDWSPDGKETSVAEKEEETHPES